MATSSLSGEESEKNYVPWVNVALQRSYIAKIQPILQKHEGLEDSPTTL